MSDKTEVGYACKVLETAAERTRYLAAVLPRLGNELLGRCIHVACLSMEGAREYQWENYAAQKRGCALKFRFAELKEVCQSPLIANFLLVYRPDLQLQMFEHVLRSAETIVLRRFHGKVRAAFNQEVLRALGELLALVKNPVHEAEMEWRLQVDHCDSAFRQVPCSDGACRRALPVCTPATLSGLMLGPECTASVADGEALLARLGYVSANVRRISLADLVS
jgi:hypothetical protein